MSTDKLGILYNKILSSDEGGQCIFNLRSAQFHILYAPHGNEAEIRINDVPGPHIHGQAALCEWMKEVNDYKQHMFREGNKYLIRDLSHKYGFFHLQSVCGCLERMCLPDKQRVYIYLIDAILIVYNHCFTELDMRKVYRQVEEEYGLTCGVENSIRAYLRREYTRIVNSGVPECIELAKRYSDKGGWHPNTFIKKVALDARLAPCPIG